MSFSSKKSSLILILDVQSSVVRGSLCIFNPKDRPHIIFSYEVPINYHIGKGSAHLIQKTTEVIGEIVHKALRSIQGKKVDGVHYVLSSPWILSQGKTVTVEFAKNTKTTRERIIEIVTKHRDEFITENQSDFEIIEEKIFDVRLDGVSIDKWQKRKARITEVSFAVSIAGSETLKQLRDACAHAVIPEQITFHSSLLLQYIAVQQTIPQYKDYTLIHAHGELTDIICVENSTCSFFASYPYGTNTIIRSIEAKLKTSQQQAESYISLYEQGSLDSSHAHSIHIAIQKVQHIWSAELLKIIGHSAITQKQNEHILLSAHAHEAFFIHALRSIPSYKTVQRLELDDIRPRVTLDPNIRVSRMTGLYVLAIHSTLQ